MILQFLFFSVAEAQIYNKLEFVYIIGLVSPGDNSTLRLIVASWLHDANTEYDSGVRNGRTIQIVEYQDAMGSISGFESLPNVILTELNQSMKAT